MESDYAGLGHLVARDRGLDWRKKLQVLAYLTTFGICLQCYNRGVSRVIRAFRRGLTAAVAAYLEDRGGMKLFTLEDDLEAMSAPELRTPFARYHARFRSRGSSDAGTPPCGESAAASQPAPPSEPEDLPDFFESAKLFACLETEDVERLFADTSRVVLAPGEALFAAGDGSEQGLFIVIQGRLDIFLSLPEDSEGAKPQLVNTLIYGESVGDLDILDGARRSVGARASAEGCTLVQVPRELFLAFILRHPGTLLVYLQLAIARLWRVASFVLSDFLQLPLEDFRGLEMAYAVQSLPPGALGGTAPSAPTSAPGSPTGRVSRRPSILKDAPGSRSASNAALARSVGALGGAHRRVSFHSEQASPFGEELRGQGSWSHINLARAAATAAALPRDTACLRDGWDVVAPHESGMRPETWERLASGAGQRLTLSPLEALNDTEEVAQAFYVLLEGSMVAERRLGEDDGVKSASVAAGSLINCAAFLSATCAKVTFAAGLETCTLAAFGNQELSAILNGLSSHHGGLEEDDVIEHQARGRSPRSPSSTIEDYSRRTAVVASSPTLGSPAASLSPAAERSASSAPGGSAGTSPPTPSLARVRTGRAAEARPRDPRSQAARDLARRSLTSNLGLVERAGSILAPRAGDGDDSPHVWAVEGSKASAETLLREEHGQGSEAVNTKGEETGVSETGLADVVVSPSDDSAHPVASPGDTAADAGAQHPRSRSIDTAYGDTPFARPRRLKKRAPATEPARDSSDAPEGSKDPSRSNTDASPPLPEAVLLVDLLLAASRALGPVIRQFLSLGLNRVWHRAGDVVYRQGDVAECMYVVISGRARLLHRAHRARGLSVEDDVGRGESMGAVWALAGGRHDTSCLCIRDAELCRLTRGSFELICSLHPRAAARLLQGMAERLAAAQAARAAHAPDPGGARSAVEETAWQKGGARRRGEIVTIAVLPAGRSVDRREGVNGGESGASATSASRSTRVRHRAARSSNGSVTGGARSSATSSTTTTSSPVRRLASELRDMLDLMWGPTLLLDADAIAAAFPTTHTRLHARFYRAKICTWLAALEEEFRFIILAGDERDTPWARICASQSDCTLLVAAPAAAAPQVSVMEQGLVWSSISRAASLVARASTLPDLLADAAWQLLGQEGIDSLLHSGGNGDVNNADAASDAAHVAAAATSASSTAAHPSHHPTTGAASLGLSALMRVELVLVHEVDATPQGTAAWLDARPLLTRHHHVRLGYDPDLARLSRWMAGRAVGVVLSGGGSRGLAHQGVLNALMDAGVPIDVVGGTSQGAFMGGLFAQNRRRAAMERAVRRYATEMGSVRKLLSDLTLPIISLFSGAGFDRVVREALGEARIEDLWLRFFCVSTNLSRGAPSVHERGPLWKMCRASMTIVGLVPPVFHDGDLLVDGGYLNNIPVDVMRGLGVGTVLVVDVEDRDQSAWHNLSPYDGGVSGWQLLWDRWCPVKAWRYNVRIPRYSQLVNSLTWMSHQQNLRRVSQKYLIDLYLRPPVFHYRLMDYYLAEKIVREASQYAWVVVSEWQARVGIHRTGLVGLLRTPGEHLTGVGDRSAGSGSARAGVGAATSIGDGRARARAGSRASQSERSQSAACMTQLRGKHSGHEGPRSARHNEWAYTRASLHEHLSDEATGAVTPRQASLPSHSSLPLPAQRGGLAWREAGGQAASQLSRSFPPPVSLEPPLEDATLSAPASPTAARLASLALAGDGGVPPSPLGSSLPDSPAAWAGPDDDVPFAMSDVAEEEP